MEDGSFGVLKSGGRPAAYGTNQARKEVREMVYKTRRMLEEELDEIREKLEEARNLIDEALGTAEDEEDEDEVEE